MDVYEKRKLLLRGSSPDLKKEDREKIIEEFQMFSDLPSRNSYRMVDFEKLLEVDKRASLFQVRYKGVKDMGYRVEVKTSEGMIPYFAVLELGDNIEQVYRIFEESDKTMKAGEVREMFEKNLVAKGLESKIKELKR